SRGHDPDRARWQHEVLQALDDTHGTQGVGYHHTYEFVGRNVGDHFTSSDAGVDEQHVQLSRCKTRSQRGHLIGIVDIHGLYFPGETGPPTTHSSGLHNTYISKEGDLTAKTEIPEPVITQSYYWLAAIDVAAVADAALLVTFGDSITDGALSTAETNHSWPA